MDRLPDLLARAIATLGLVYAITLAIRHLIGL
jgi:hypothetical protein